MSLESVYDEFAPANGGLRKTRTDQSSIERTATVAKTTGELTLKSLKTIGENFALGIDVAGSSAVKAAKATTSRAVQGVRAAPSTARELAKDIAGAVDFTALGAAVRE